MVEIIDGFQVTDGRKELWKKELDMIGLIEKICKENNLNYFLIGGAAIGAERHHGFIPWDDDMDIGMLRDDFEKFVRLFDKYKNDNYVMEYGFDINQSCGTFMRIRDINTTAIIKDQYRGNREHGVFVEVYPFDHAISDKLKRNRQIKKSRRMRTELAYRLESCPYGKRGIIPHIIYSVYSTKTLWNKWLATCTMYNDIETEYVDTIAMPGYALQGIHLYRLKDVISSQYADYNGRSVRVAVGNKKCLEIHFGDYMTLPPIEERGMKHSTSVFYDAYTPWREYMMTKDRKIVEDFFNGNYKLSNIW